MPFDAPTCTRWGSEVSTCGTCGETRSRGVPELGHLWGPYIQTKAPDCTNKGVETRTCARCGDTQTRSIPAKGHKSDENWVIVRAPEMSKPGLKITTCLVCGKYAKTQNYAPRGYRYEVKTQAFGIPADQVNSTLRGRSEQFIYLDLKTDSTLVIPLVTQDNYKIGSATIMVTSGGVTVSLSKDSSPTLLRYRTWHLFSDPKDIRPQDLMAASLPFDQIVFGNGESALIHITTTSNYYQGNENKPFSAQSLSTLGQFTWAEVVADMISAIRD